MTEHTCPNPYETDVRVMALHQLDHLRETAADLAVGFAGLNAFVDGNPRLERALATVELELDARQAYWQAALDEEGDEDR